MRGAREVLDEMLVLSCQNGDARALELLARRWYPRLLGHAYRLTGNREAAADAVQEAWIGIVRGIGRLRDPARFGSWALRIVRNKSRDWIRVETRRRAAARGLESQATEGGSPYATAVGPEGADGPISGWQTPVLRRAISELGEEQRVILRLFYLEDRPIGHIAEILGLPAGTVKSRLFYARRRLRESLDNAAGSDPARRQDG